MIPRIRKGNDFKHIWPITWNGQPEDFSDATDITLTAKVYGQVKALVEGVDYHIDGGNVVVDFTPAICDITGTYTVELNYIKPSAEFVDGDRRSAVDVQAFQIVNTSAEANATEGVSLPSEAMAAYALKYDDLTEAQKDELRGKGITSIDLTGEVGDTKTYTITYADGLTFDFSVTDGHTPIFEFVGTVLHIDGVAGPDLKGETGNGIASVELTSTVGLVKTYTITFTDATTTTFTVTDGAAAVVQEKGSNTSVVMSQKAVTDELDQLAGEVSQKQSIVVDYTHTGNKEVNIESIDFATGTITATGHGLAVNNIVYPINKGVGNFPFSALPDGLNPFTQYYVVNVTPNTFQLSLTSGGAPITLSDKATKDYSKWHFEITGNVIISDISLRKFTVEFEGKSSGSPSAGDYFYLTGGKDYGGTGFVWIADTEYGKITSGLSRAIFRSMANGDVWSYNRLEIDVTGKKASILINGYRIYSLTETTRGIIRHNNEVAVHSSVGEDVVIRLYQVGVFNGMNIKVTKIL